MSSDEDNNSGSPTPRGDSSSDNEERSPPPPKEKPVVFPLHVGNISYSTTESTLRDTFSKYGQVSAANVVKNHDGSSRGHAFVDMDTEDNAKLAISKLDGTELDGRTITVQFKKSRDELHRDGRPPRSSRDRFDDRRGRDRRSSSRYDRYDRDDRYYDRRDRYREDRHRSRRSYDYDSPPPRHRRSRSPRGRRNDSSE
ncbi:splicing factor, arginine/serine-rich [Tritrichomonas foetus]|uniref:Splicing factor, arginine/serine-rich n=1 Tax=Tritrichomonas foetus TaxID=1144522 RepID=A0A1J4J8W3_9EUKA|nr:splicing factor, arginine/serine-rich [Tritrichomonas foetus]|eukprot:OHS95622.1 splicing factor, arginine/serine-rich [Tritrichomonas foetus]